MTVTWQTPSGKTWKLCDDLLKQEHLAIGGTTGSGKSTLLHSLIYSALIHSPVRAQFILIDLKGVELMDYEHLPHTIAYADEPDEAIRALEYAVRLMRNRLDVMKRERKKMYEGSDIYIIIDELAVLMQTTKAKTLPLLADLMRLGRAAKVHVIGATQNPNRSSGGGMPSIIAQNVTAVLALRCRSRIESNCLGVKGAELLPRIGKGIYWNADGTTEVTIPKTDEHDLAERINYWLNAKPERAKEQTTCHSQNSFFSRLAQSFAR